MLSGPYITDNSKSQLFKPFSCAPILPLFKATARPVSLQDDQTLHYSTHLWLHRHRSLNSTIFNSRRSRPATNILQCDHFLHSTLSPSILPLLRKHTTIPKCRTRGWPSRHLRTLINPIGFTLRLQSSLQPQYSLSLRMAGPPGLLRPRNYFRGLASSPST